MTDIKLLLKEFGHYAYGQSKHTTFTDFLDWALFPFKWFDSAEGQQKALETYQTHPKVTQLVKLIQLIGDASEEFCDPLGELCINKQFRVATMANIGHLNLSVICFL
jgi:hypothetical protein